MHYRHAQTFLVSLCLMLTLLACDSSAANDTDLGTGIDDFTSAKGVLKHNFGTLRHGDRAHHDFVIPMDRRYGDLVPVRFQVPCACASSVFVIVGRDGSERIATGQGAARYAVQEEEKLILRVTLETSQREAHDEAETGIAGVLVLQTATAPFRRRNHKIQFRFGVDAPIDIRPYAHLDLKEIPRSGSFSQTFELHGDDPKLEYGEIRCLEKSTVPGMPKTAKDLSARLEQEKDYHLLHITFRPGAERLLGAFLIQVEIETNLDQGYVLRLPVSGNLIGDIQLSPPGVFSYGQLALEAPKTVFLIITDFDKKRPAPFVVSSLVDNKGVDISSHFTVTFEPVAGKPRSQRIHLGYLGTLAGRSYIRGVLNLAKETGGPHVQSIDITAFHQQ